MKFLKKHGYWVLWGALAVAAAVIWLHTDVNGGFMGIVETHTHKLGAQEPGKIARVEVSLGEEVKAGQLLAAFDTSGIDSEKAWLEVEIGRLQEMTGSDRSRYALQYQRMLAQRDQSVGRYAERRSALESKRDELKSIVAEIGRLALLQDSGLGRPRELSDLTIRRDTLSRFVNEESTAIENESRKETARGAGTGAAENDIVMSMMGKRLDRASELKQRLENLEIRRRDMMVRSPVAGRVVKIFCLPGDAVKEFSPLITVEEARAEYIDAYVPETSGQAPRLGERVSVHPHRAGGKTVEGTVVFLDPGYSPIPERLAFRKMIYWARQFRVKLDSGHTMMPGEAARVVMLGEISPVNNAEAGTLNVPAPEDGGRKTPPVFGKGDMTPVTVPEELHRRSSFEPSGMTWLSDIDRYLVVSDDTAKGSPGHTPWVFLMDR
ncbi:MAG: hypothetical protein WC889_11575, partial [Myxococcota bacterium]